MARSAITYNAPAFPLLLFFCLKLERRSRVFQPEPSLRKRAGSPMPRGRADEFPFSEELVQLRLPCRNCRDLSVMIHVPIIRRIPKGSQWLELGHLSRRARIGNADSGSTQLAQEFVPEVTNAARGERSPAPPSA